jgi:hypothetical protein
MKLKNFKVPAIVAAALVALYFLVRKTNAMAAASASLPQTQPSTAASGVPLFSPSSGSTASSGEDATMPKQSVPKYGTGAAPVDTHNTALNPVTAATRANQILQQAFEAGNDEGGNIFYNTRPLPTTAQSTAKSTTKEKCGCNSPCDQRTDKPDMHFTDGQGSVQLVQNSQTQWDKLNSRYPGIMDRWSKTVQIAAMIQ